MLDRPAPAAPRPLTGRSASPGAPKRPGLCFCAYGDAGAGIIDLIQIRAARPGVEVSAGPPAEPLLAVRAASPGPAWCRPGLCLCAQEAGSQLAGFK